MDADLFLAKALLGLSGIVTLVWYTQYQIVRHRFSSFAQAIRRIALFGFAVTVSYASVDQLRNGEPWYLRHTISLISIGLLNIALVVSLREARLDSLAEREKRRGAANSMPVQRSASPTVTSGAKSAPERAHRGS